jgi:hypothetical protein
VNAEPLPEKRQAAAEEMGDAFGDYIVQIRDDLGMKTSAELRANAPGAEPV